MTALMTLKPESALCIGVVGLGIIGSAIARHLALSGYQITGYDPDQLCQTRARSFGVKTLENARAVGEYSDVVLLSLPSAEALDETVTRLIKDDQLRLKNLVVVDLSTLSLHSKRYNYDRLANAGIHFYDCPISGTGAQAETGDVVVYASGDEKNLEYLIPILECFSRAVFNVGEFGQGTKTKIVANLLVAIHNVATAEALTLATNCGLDLNTFCEVIAAGA
ncbi:MAG: NAD(P)-dependent oxidoreductase, partial [Burkholderiales bacterium]|nr:NAD(P)-dependent oxidoreductase [Burkholderiales bacterium]